MWILTLDNRNTVIYQDINKALNALANEALELKDKVLLEEYSDWASCYITYTPIGDKPEQDWQKIDVFKGEKISFYIHIDKSKVMKERGITESDIAI